MLYAIAATTAQRIEHPGTGATSPNAYFVMVGPLEPQRAYHPWLVSAVSMANTLRTRAMATSPALPPAQMDARSVATSTTFLPGQMAVATSAPSDRESIKSVRETLRDSASNRSHSVSEHNVSVSSAVGPCARPRSR